ncbi:MAG: hypothetical protein R8G66_13725 [Cytophagales bacterium]|nr:hypothetical protein [Cytophagales bacterium]
MSLTRSLSAVFCLLALHVSWAQSPQRVKAFAMKYANRYCSNAPEILAAEDAKSIAFYMDNESQEIDIGNFGTAVHEGLHNYDWDLGNEAENATPQWNDRWKSYFINTGIVLSTEEKPVFKTSTMHRNYFPQAVREMSRYGTYIQQWGDDVSDENNQLSKSELSAYGVEELLPGEARTTSNVKGIYGLMEEFNAYHHGIKAEYELITGMEDPKISGSTNSVASYFEFNVFIAYYLKYARERERETYQMLMNDKNLRIAYTLIELSWRELITQVYDHELTTGYFMYWQGEPDLLTDELRGVLNSFMIPVSELREYAQYARSKQFDPDVKALILRKIDEDGNKSVSWSSSDDDDWGNWDDDDRNSSSAEFTIDLEPMIEGRHYVVVHVEKDMFELMSKINEYEGSDMKIGTGSNMRTYYFFLGEYRSKTDAQAALRKNRAKYPNIKVVTWK